jgi:hypothetical protein
MYQSGAYCIMKFQLQTLEEYSDEALLAELRRVADALQGKRLTLKHYDEVARAHSTTLRSRFGSWSVAQDKAGISESIAPRRKVLSRGAVLQALRDHTAENPAKSVTEKDISIRLGFHPGAIIRRFGKWERILAEVDLQPTPMGRRYTDEECLENILTLWTHYGRQPNFGELKHAPSRVGPKAYIRRWGGWRSALSAFVRQVNEPESAPAAPQSVTHIREEQEDLLPPPPRSISISLRYKILSRDKFRCVACGASPAKDGSVELHVDHIIPWSRGGLNTEENLRTLCLRCNLGKGAAV